MASSHKITFSLRGQSYTSIIPLDADSKKCRDVRALIAEKLCTQEDDIALYPSGSPVAIHLDEDIRAYSLLEVVRGLLNTSNSSNRTLTAAQQKQRKDAKDVKVIIGASGSVVTLQRGVYGSSSETGSSTTTATTGGASTEDEMIRKMQEQVAQETGVDGGGFRRPGPRPGSDAAAAAVPFREPPKGYICHNCGKGGHHINHCPEARNGFNKVKLLQAPVGIPESMLERCDPSDTRAKFVTRDGVTVVRKAVANASEMLIDTSAAHGRSAVADAPDHLVCKLCKKALSKAVRTPCCDIACCESCLLDAPSVGKADVDDGPPTCPLCDEPLMIDDIQADVKARKELEELARKRPRPS